MKAVTYAYWLTVASAIAASPWFPWLTIGTLAGFGCSLRAAYLMGERAGIEWRSQL